MSDALGNRMKENYENRTRYHLPRRTYTIIRLDGKAFHTFTKKLKRPYDLDFMKVMDLTAADLCKEIQGAKFAYVQSDEISILITDFETIKKDSWFDGNIQKIVSVSASVATASFNKHIANNENLKSVCGAKSAHFDSRVFTISDIFEVENYFIWRQIDATKNSIQMLGQAHFSHKELHGKNGSDIQDMLMNVHNINWNNEPVGFKRGRTVVKHTYEMIDQQAARIMEELLKKNGTPNAKVGLVTRTKWISDEPPIFTQNREYLRSMIPSIGVFGETEND